METTPIDTRRWYEASHSRRSVRVFHGPPDEAQWKRLKMLVSALDGDGVRVALFGATNALFSGFAARRIKNAQYAAAVITGADAELSRAGFKGEALVLECTAMGLGTCWLGASFNKKEAVRLSGIAEGEELRALIAIGVPEQPLSVIQDADRKRRELGKLVLTAKGVSLADMEPWQNTALKCARIAPSALNLQPWRFAFVPGHICMVSGGLFSAGTQLDLGIAMLHVELGAAAHGVSGVWLKDIQNAAGGKKKPKRADPSEMVWVFAADPTGSGNG